MCIRDRKYKTSYWDDIPSWAKDDDGDWIVCYVGTISIITNNALVDKAPQSFQDILEGDYKVTIGDVSAASQAQHAILATAYAMGGDMDNLQPAYDFWSTLEMCIRDRKRAAAVVLAIGMAVTGSMASFAANDKDLVEGNYGGVTDGKADSVLTGTIKITNILSLIHI